MLRMVFVRTVLHFPHEKNTNLEGLIKFIFEVSMLFVHHIFALRCTRIIITATEYLSVSASIKPHEIHWK